MQLQEFGLCLLFIIGRTVEVFSEGVTDNLIANSSQEKTPTIPQHFHTVNNEKDNQSDATTHKHDPNSVFDVLIKTFYIVDDPSQNSQIDSKGLSDSVSTNDVSTKQGKLSNSGVPEIEMEKLKSAAKNAGLAQAKADRVARAAAAMNMQYNDIVELRKMLNNPATSAEYADKVRRALEDAVVEQALKKNGQGIENNEIQSQHVPFDDHSNPSQPNKEKFPDSVPNGDIHNHPVAPTPSHVPINNPFDRDSQAVNSIFPSPEKFFEGLHLPSLPPLLKAFALPSGLFGSHPTEKSPLLDLWKASSPILGSNQAYRLTLVCHNLGLTKEEILDLQHLFSDPVMTKEKGVQLLATYEKRLSDTAKAKLSNPNLDPVTLQNLKSMATISGLDEHSANRLVRAVMDANLDPDQVMKFSKAIQETAPSDADLKKITNHLEADTLKKAQVSSNSNNNNVDTVVHDGGFEKEWTDTDDSKGAEWIFRSTEGNENTDTLSSKHTRALDSNHEHAPMGELLLYTARKHCGFSPIVEPNRLSNTSPGQFPWTAAVLSSRDEFLCFGTLLNEGIVICPASCILKYSHETQNQQPMKVTFGWSLVEGHENHFPPLTIHVASAVIHPLADGSHIDIANGDYNIALLKLSSNIDFDNYPTIFPICTIGASYEQYSGTSNCRILYWPHLPNMETWRPRTYLTSSNVAVSKGPNCGGPGANYCITGQVCASNEGSPVICLTNSKRYYLWGLVKRESNCDRSSTATIPVSPVLNSYDFISEYLFTFNRRTSHTGPSGSSSGSSPTETNHIKQ